MRRLFLDASALMEILLGRPKSNLISEILHDSTYEFSMSTLTIHNLYYFTEVENIDRGLVKELVDLAKHLPLNDASVLLAQQRYTNKDFEDCLQAACAEKGGCDEILSLDKDFAKNSGTTLKVLSI